MSDKTNNEEEENKEVEREREEEEEEEGEENSGSSSSQDDDDDEDNTDNETVASLKDQVAKLTKDHKKDRQDNNGRVASLVDAIRGLKGTIDELSTITKVLIKEKDSKESNSTKDGKEPKNRKKDEFVKTKKTSPLREMGEGMQRDIRHTSNSIKTSVKENPTNSAKHGTWVKMLMRNFRAYGCEEIVDDDPKVWADLCERSPEEAKRQNAVMTIALNGLVTTGTAHFKLVEQMKRTDTDGRREFIVVQKAHHLHTDALTISKFKEEIKKHEWKGPKGNYDTFLLRLYETTDNLVGLTTTTGKKVALEEEEVAHLVMEKIQTSRHYTEEEKNKWKRIFNKEQGDIEKTGIELSVDSLNDAIRRELDIEKSESTQSKAGRVNQQQIDKSDVTCFNCQNKGHYSNECPLPDRRKGGGQRKETRTCHICKKKGHIAKFCRSKNDKNNKDDENQKGKNNQQGIGSHIDEELISNIVRSTIKSMEEGKATKQTQYWPKEEEPHPWESGHSKAQKAVSCHAACCHNPFTVLSNDWDSDESDESVLEQVLSSLGVSDDELPVEKKEQLLVSEVENLQQQLEEQRRKKIERNKTKKKAQTKRRNEKRNIKETKENKTETTTNAIPQSAEKSFQDEVDELLRVIDDLLLDDEVESEGEPREEKESGSNQDQESRSQ